MSGYLQRLATSTRQITSAIHPAVGSVYSSRRRDHRLENDLGAEQQTSKYEHRDVFSRTQTTEPERYLPVVEQNRDISPIEQASPQLLMPPAADIRPSIQQNEAADGAPTDQSLQSDSFTSPKRPQLKEPANSPLESTRFNQSTSSTFPPPPAPVNRTLGSVIEQLMESGATPAPSTGITPLTRQDRMPPEGGELTEVRPVRIDIGQERKAHNNQQRPPQKEPDEIQIHIGRIEVTAVQAPPVVSPPSRQRDPGPSLEEYLQRRGRNNR